LHDKIDIPADQSLDTQNPAAHGNQLNLQTFFSKETFRLGEDGRKVLRINCRKYGSDFCGGCIGRERYQHGKK
jgi:hypothetical protein